MSSAARQLGLQGRAVERAMLDDLVADVRKGKSRSLVIRGEAGIGKTALLGNVVATASDVLVLRAVGVDSEMELAYASLHQLCAPLLGEIEALPGPQRDALGVAFGLRAGLAPDRFLVGLAVLSLLSEGAEERPLLCVIDDAQWLDEASALTLAFVARRLWAEPVGMLFAARESGPGLREIPELQVRGLDNDDARALLTAALPFKLDAGVRERIVAETRGNPLALLELPRGLSASELAGGFGLFGIEGLATRIEQSFARRLSRLPEEARDLLLLAAAEPAGDPLVLIRAAEAAGVDVGQVATDGLLAIEERAIFRHPLVRSAVYRAASVHDRRNAHRRLAEATDPRADPDRRAWHLAAAAGGPDEQVAEELERSAGRAQARGGMVAAAAFLQRSVALTKEPALRAGRALAAAHASFQAGDFASADRLLWTAETEDLKDADRAQIDLIRARIAFAVNRGSDAPPLLLNAARQLAPLDPAISRDTFLEAIYAAIFAGRLGRGTVMEVALAAREAPPAADPPRPADLLLDGYALAITEGYEAGAPVLKEAISAYRSEDIAAEDLLRWGFLASAAALMVWDEEAWRELPIRQAELGREIGALAVLPMSLTHQIGRELHRGNLDAAESLLKHLETVCQATGRAVPPYAGIAYASWRGREAEHDELRRRSIKAATERGEGLGLTYVEWLTTAFYNGLGRYEDAVKMALSASNHFEELQHHMRIHELVEAAARSGQVTVATGALEQVSTMARISPTDWALGIEARCRALLSDDDGAAEDLYRSAIEHLERTQARIEVARARLLYGEWLRRRRRRVDARDQLRSAHEEFATMGAEGFAERARVELAATGETIRRRTVETRDDLTPQERQIALLARERLSTPEIAAQLFLSPRTVEWHLGKVYSKLGIRSRRELAGVLR